MTNFCLRRLFPPNVSADLLPSLPDVPATLHCCLSRLLCGECSGHLARSMREPAVPRGWLTSPDRAAQGPTACRVGKGTVAQALPGASRPPRCPLPTLPCQAISHYRWEVGPLSDNAHAHARARTHAHAPRPRAFFAPAFSAVTVAAAPLGCPRTRRACETAVPNVGYGPDFGLGGARHPADGSGRRLCSPWSGRRSGS